MDFSLSIGSLKFNAESTSMILVAFLLMGILTGLYSAIHIENPRISQAITSPILWAFVIPAMLLIKGIHKAKEVDKASAK